MLSKGIKARKIKSLINFLNSNSNTCITWADLVATDWSNFMNPLSDLIKSNSLLKNRTTETSVSGKFGQKLTLA